MFSVVNLAVENSRKCKNAPELTQFINEGDGTEIFTRKEVDELCSLAMATKDAKTFQEICYALNVREDWGREVLNIPDEVSEMPEYVVHIVASVLILSMIEEGRTHTCQSCGRSFMSETEKMFCSECEHVFVISL